LVEQGAVSQVFRQPGHPYTNKLVSLAARYADNPADEAVTDSCST